MADDGSFKKKKEASWQEKSTEAWLVFGLTLIWWTFGLFTLILPT